MTFSEPAPKPEVVDVDKEYPHCPSCDAELKDVDSRKVRIDNFYCLFVWCRACKALLPTNVFGEVVERPSGILDPNKSGPPFNITRKQ